MSGETIRTDFLVLGSGIAGLRAALGLARRGARAGRDQGPAHGEQHRLRAGRRGGGHGRRRRHRPSPGGHPGGGGGDRLGAGGARARGGGPGADPRARLLGRPVRSGGGALPPHPRRRALPKPGAARARGRHRLGDGADPPREDAEDGGDHAPLVRLLHRPRDRGRAGRGLPLPHRGRCGRRSCSRGRRSWPPGGRGRSSPRPRTPRWRPATAWPWGCARGPRCSTWSSCSSTPPPSISPGAPRFLISEAVRGEGAWLINGKGERFVDELLSRDQVARAIVREAAAGTGPGRPGPASSGPEPRAHALPAHPRDVSALRARHHAGAGSRHPRRALRDGRGGDRPLGADDAARPLRRGRVRGHGSARSEPPGQQLAPRGSGLRGPRGGGDGRGLSRRARRRRRRRRIQARVAGRDAKALRADLRRRAWQQLGLERDAAGLRDLLAWLDPLRSACPPRRATGRRPSSGTWPTSPGPWPRPPSSARRAGAGTSAGTSPSPTTAGSTGTRCWSRPARGLPTSTCPWAFPSDARGRAVPVRRVLVVLRGLHACSCVVLLALDLGRLPPQGPHGVVPGSGGVVRGLGRPGPPLQPRLLRFHARAAPRRTRAWPAFPASIPRPPRARPRSSSWPGTWWSTRSPSTTSSCS